MSERLSKITDCVKEIDYAEIVEPFVESGSIIRGSVALTVEMNRLFFAVVIYPQYPMQFHDTETIKFINQELLPYDHVNADGSVCVHTLHSVTLEEKIQLDFNSLKHWINKYYISKEKDESYEHIIVQHKNFSTSNPIFLFTEVDYTFRKGQFGYFNYTNLSRGVLKEEQTVTNLVQDFSINKNVIPCKWSKFYQGLTKNEGIFYFIETAPVRNRRFAVDNWKELEAYATQEFLTFLNQLDKKLRVNKSGLLEIPLLIGYKISDDEIHWQAIRIPTDSFPGYGEKILGLNTWVSRLHEQEIIWAQTRNCSYKYFFGRGKFHEKLTGSRILIIGIGAIGSMVATTLVRGGCTKIVLFDHDGKEPENVCRSEYKFSTGISDKVSDMGAELSFISPFAEIEMNQRFVDFAKIGMNDNRWKETLAKMLDVHDVIFDCTTDNDVAHILDQLSTKSKLFNLSITNHAKELVCAVGPKMYEWLFEIFRKLENNAEDLYNPTGCWSPTFKASYNDIAVLVQYAIKQINTCFESEMPVRNFYLSTEKEKGFTIKLNQF